MAKWRVKINSKRAVVSQWYWEASHVSTVFLGKQKTVLEKEPKTAAREGSEAASIGAAPADLNKARSLHAW